MILVEQCKAIIECYDSLDKEFTNEFIYESLVNTFVYLWGIPIIFSCIAADFIWLPIVTLLIIAILVGIWLLFLIIPYLFQNWFLALIIIIIIILCLRLFYLFPILVFKNFFEANLLNFSLVVL